MAIGTKVCKVCGKEYEACRTLRPNLNNEFRWQDVACSPEHGAEYLRRVLVARGKATAMPDTEQAIEPPVDVQAETEKKPARKRACKKAEE